MRAEELIVEVRDAALQRVGSITPEYRQMKIVPRANDVGTWSLTLPGDHPMVSHLETPGSGIVITQIIDATTTRVLMSGPTTLPKSVRNRDNVDRLLTFDGVSDTTLAADAVAYGDPANDVDAQITANDTRTAVAETLMRAYVNDNIGPGALASRRIGMRTAVVLAADLGRGPTMTKSPRFQNLLDLLREIATYSSLRFRFVQSGDSIVFEIDDAHDRTDLVRLDIENGTLASEEIEQRPASTTRAIIAGQGEGTDRLIIKRTSTASLAAETQWGRVIERFLDARDKSLLSELQQQGDEFLIENGATAYAVKANASDNQTMLYGVDWVEGDIVAVVIQGVEYSVDVTSAAIVMNSDGVLVGAAIGDVAKMSESTSIEQRVDQNEQRISTIERTTEGVSGVSEPTPGTLVVRDTAGRTAFANPLAADDADTLGARNTAIAVETAARTAAIAAAGVDTPTANTVVRRDAAGRTAFASPSATDDAANKAYVDAKVWDGNDITTGTVVAARLPAASETASGIIERATVAEAVAGTDTTRAVTPAGVDAAVAAVAAYTCRLTKTAAQNTSGTAGEMIAVGWNVADQTHSGMWDGNTAIYPNKAGRWRVQGKVRGAASSADSVFVQVRMNNANNSASEQLLTDSRGGPYPRAEDIFNVTSVGSQYFQLYVASLGVNRSLVPSNCILLAEWIGT